MKKLELKIPPVVVVFLTALLMWIVSLKTPQMVFSMPLQRVLAVSLVLVGLATAMRGVLAFRQARTTVNPTKPQSSSALVMTGIYRRTRNPMYLSFLLVLTGWAVWLANGPAWAFLPAFILFMNRFQIEPEERALASLFGDSFKSYCSKVRRWI